MNQIRPLTLVFLFWFLVNCFMCTHSSAGPAVVFNGNAVKTLKQNINLNGFVSILTGTDNPSVTPVSAQKGSLYIRYGASGGLSYIKQDDGLTINWAVVQTSASSGSVTSVALSLPGIFNVSGSPVTTSGTLTGTLASQSQNLVFSSPNGSSGAPTFRPLVSADIPNLSAAKITSGQGTLSTSTTGVTIGSGTNTLLSNASVNIQNSDSTHNGLLTSTDWSTFNGKQNALTRGNLTETNSSVLAITGGTNAILGSGTTIEVQQSTAGQNGYLSSADWSTFNSKISSSRAINTSAPISGGGDLSTDRTISISQSGSSTDGYLSSTDWNTFNNKQSSGSFISALTGDATATGPGSAALTLATVNSNTGSFGSSTAIPNFTVNGKGLITAAGTNSVIAPAGTLTGTTLASNVVTSSLTSVGTIGSGTWQGTKVGLAYGGTNADLSATGGTSQVLRQSTTGANITVSQLACADLSNATASCSTDATNASNISTGTLAATRGGTGTGTYTLGDTLYSGATNSLSKLSGNTTSTKNFLTQTGTGSVSAAPAWGTISAGDVPTLNQNTTGTASNVTASSNSTLTTLSALSLPTTQLTGTLQAAQFPALTGDVTTTAGSLATTLATVNSNVGSFGSSTSIPSFTVNAKGLMTAASGNAVIAPAGTLSGTTLNSSVVSSSLTSVGTISSGTWNGSTIAVANGGTGVTSVTTTPTATAFAGWDSDLNFSANNFLGGYATNSATGTITLTVSSPSIQRFTGAATTTVVLPVASTLVDGTTFTLINYLGSASMTVQTSGGNVLTTGFGSGSDGFVTVATVINHTAGTGLASWYWTYSKTDPTASPIYGVSGDITGNLTLPSAGAYNIGNTSRPLGNLTANQVTIYDNFGDSEGLFVVTSYPHLRAEATAPAGNFAIASANNGSGASGSLTFAPGTSSSGVQGQVKLGGHIISNAIATSPGVSSCGTSPSISGTDTAGAVTVGTGGVATSCTLTFGQAWSSTPHCIVNYQGAITVVSAVPTTTTVVFSSTAPFVAGSLVDYICVGN